MFQSMICSSICGHPAAAIAELSGGTEYPDIKGIVRFYEAPYAGILVEAEIVNLPIGSRETPAFFGFHIHETGDCSENFTKTGGHYNPQNHMHPSHAGDMPPLLSGNGCSYLCFYDSCLDISEVFGKSVIVHAKADDFTTQPSGNSGDKIACGVINKATEQ